MRHRLFDQLVGGDEQTRRHGQAEGLRCFHVDDSFVLGRRLNGKIGGLLTMTGNGTSLPIAAPRSTRTVYTSWPAGLMCYSTDRVDQFRPPTRRKTF